MVMLTIDRGGQEILPVLSHEEEAKLFLKLVTLSDGWRAAEIEAGELVSVLCGSCKGVEGVALDPLPKIEAVRAIRFESLGRERFMNLLIAEGKSLNRTARTRIRSKDSIGTKEGRLGRRHARGGADAR